MTVGRSYPSLPGQLSSSLILEAVAKGLDSPSDLSAQVFVHLDPYGDRVLLELL